MIKRLPFLNRGVEIIGIICAVILGFFVIILASSKMANNNCTNPKLQGIKLAGAAFTLLFLKRD